MKYLLFLISVSFLPTLYAHESPDPIDVTCILDNYSKENAYNTDKTDYYQELKPIISARVIKQHLDELENGIYNGYTLTYDTEFSVVARVKTSEGITHKTMTLTAQYDESSKRVTVEDYTTNISGLPAPTRWKYSDKKSYEESFSNSVVSCKIYP